MGIMLKNVTAEQILEEAKKYIGTPYVYGGNGDLAYCTSSTCTFHDKNKKYKGYDCSGYVCKVLSKFNFNVLGRTTSSMRTQTKYGKRITDKSLVKPGDILCFPGHVGICSRVVGGDIFMYHSPKCGKYICEANIKYHKFESALRVIEEKETVKKETIKKETNDNGKQTLCVASYTIEINAERLVNELVKKGIPNVFVVEIVIKNIKYYRVCTGKFTTKKSLETRKNLLESKGYKSTFGVTL